MSCQMGGGQRPLPSHSVVSYGADLLLPESWGESGENGAEPGEKAAKEKLGCHVDPLPDL